MNFAFVITNALLGIGLAMDAFSVSLADGLHEPCMKRKKIFLIAIVFAISQGIMPLIGWFCVHSIAEKSYKMLSKTTKMWQWQEV